MSVDVKIETSIDLPGLIGRLEGISRQMFENSAVDMQRAIKDQWTGWKYEGRNLATTGASQAGWRYELQTVEGERSSIIFSNPAKDYYTNKPYVSYVARRKGATPEWELVREMLVEDYLPKLQENMLQAIRDAATTTGSYKKVRENRASTATEIVLEI